MTCRNWTKSSCYSLLPCTSSSLVILSWTLSKVESSVTTWGTPTTSIPANAALNINGPWMFLSCYQRGKDGSRENWVGVAGPPRAVVQCTAARSSISWEAVYVMKKAEFRCTDRNDVCNASLNHKHRRTCVARDLLAHLFYTVTFLLWKMDLMITDVRTSTCEGLVGCVKDKFGRHLLYQEGIIKTRVWYFTFCWCSCLYINKRRRKLTKFLMAVVS